MRFGKKVASSGKRMTIKRHRNKAITNGMADLYIVPRLTPATSFMTKRFMPKGGVIDAILSRITISTPNHIRSQLKTFAIGTKIGTQIRSIGIDGRKQPRMTNTSIIMNRTSPPETSKLAMVLASSVGILVRAIK